MKTSRPRPQLYRRLLRLARPYSGRLIIGILAGLLCAGTFLGMLSFTPDALDSFEHVGRPVPAVSSSPETPGWFRTAERLATRFNLPLRNADDTITWQAVLLGFIGLPLIVLLRIAASYVHHYQMRWVGARVVRDLRDLLFDSLQRQSLKFFGGCDIGRLISRCVNDTAGIENVIAVTAADIVRAPFEILAAGGFAVFYVCSHDLARFLLAGMIALPLCLLPVMILGRHVRRWTRRSLERISDLVSRMHENFTGIRIVKAFHTEAAESRRFHEMNARYFQSVVRALRAELLMSPLMEIVSTLLACGFVALCFVCKIRLQQIIVIGISTYAAYRPFKQLTRINASLQRGAAALDRVFTLLDTDTSLPEPAAPVPKPSFDDRVVFDHVSFRFSPDGPDVIRDVTFELPRGTVLALVGETGAGKSTLANLLARFYDPTAGRVTLDGIDLRDIATADLRRLIGVVTQDTILFNDTIARNIAYGSPDAPREQIEAAARLANAHDFIVAHPQGYDRVVGEKGFVLSGGEKQRVALARAILRNPPILILDEATSALDTVTERLVQEAIARAMRNRTVMAIAHRLATVRRADQILVIESGCIVERGTHAELLARGGRYRRLCDMQWHED
jgi:subfamily B ATP-binding cassette protein MsbA